MGVTGICALLNRDHRRSLFIVCGILLTGFCSADERLVGSWVKPVVPGSDNHDGFALHDGGCAESINSYTLLYRHWRMEEGKLFLIVESIGNRTSSVDRETYTIRHLDEENLVLVNEHGYEIAFTRAEPDPGRQE